MILTVLCVVGFVYLFFPTGESGVYLVPDNDSIDRQYTEFISSLVTVHETTRPNSKPVNQVVRYTLGNFDPNTVDSVTLVNMGLAHWIAGNIIKYRHKGGIFHKAEDFRKIYGLTDGKYKELFPYIRIGERFVRPVHPELYRVDSKDTLRIEKYPAGTIVDLNKADTAELKKIPGIGKGIAGMIVSYRNKLGGFYSVEQLREIHLNSDELSPWFSVNKDLIRKINLNRVGIDRLRSHPYFNFYQAKAIVEYRMKNGPLSTLRTFSLYEEFTELDFERMSYYICFE